MTADDGRWMLTTNNGRLTKDDRRWTMDDGRLTTTMTTQQSNRAWEMDEEDGGSNERR